MQPEFTVEVIGCGNAYDGDQVNASLLVSEPGYQLLIDCGPTVPAALFRRQMAPNSLDAIYLTHIHPDHCLGLTSLLNWMDAKGRTKPLLIITQQDQWQPLAPLIRFAHLPQPNLGFELHWQRSETLQQLASWQVRTPATRHAVANLSLHLTSPSGWQLFYSGDGQLTEEGQQLASQSDWVFIECETLMPHPSHGCWQQIAAMPRKVGSQWRLYHIDAALRAPLAAELSIYPGMALAASGEYFDYPSSICSKAGC